MQTTSPSQSLTGFGFVNGAPRRILCQTGINLNAAKSMTHSPGIHALLDLYDCDAALLADVAALQALLQRAADAAGATTLAAHFHHFGDGMGDTGVLLLAESHISIHTWPEHRFAALDVFLCGDGQLERARALLCEGLRAGRADWREFSRGISLKG